MGNYMTNTQTQILKSLSQPDAFLSITNDSANILLGDCAAGGNYQQTSGPFLPKDYIPLIAAGCVIRARGYAEGMYRLWDIEVAHQQGTQA